MISEINKDRISVSAHTFIGIVAGYISLFSGRALHALGLAIILLIITGFIVQKSVGKGKKMSWWLGNGVAVYVFVWLVSWILFSNLNPVQA